MGRSPQGEPGQASRVPGPQKISNNRWRLGRNCSAIAETRKLDATPPTASTLPHLKFLPRRSEIAKLIQVIAQKLPHHGRITRPRGEPELKEQQPGGVPYATYRQLTAGGGGYCAMRR